MRAETATDRVLSFRVGEHVYAVPASGLREVTRRPVLTRVPQSPSTLAGLMNFHGTAIPVVRLSAMLGLPPGSETEANRVIVYGEALPTGLLVDSVLDLEAMTAKSGRRLDIDALLASSFPPRPATRLAVARPETRAAGEHAPEDTVSLFGMRLADQRFALPLEAVLEVLVMPRQLAVVPRSGDSVVGMLEWRGNILPLISLATLFGLPPSTGRANIVVTRLADAMIGLVSGAIDGVLRVPVSKLEAVPAILQRGESEGEIDAIARVGTQHSLVSVLSPSKLFRNRDIGRALDGRTQGAVEVHAEVNVVATLQLVVFSLGDELFGLPMGAVAEIVQMPEALTRVPKAPGFVAGVMNLRGRALPVIDLRQRFQSNQGSVTARPRVLVVATEQLQAGFIVDGVSEILRVQEDAVSAAPPMPGDDTRVFDRVTPGRADGTMILIVDPQELLDRAERDLLAAFEPTPEARATT